ncbi:MAG: hypothetical protein V4671_18400 [Armatimonadota bacterium]
MAVVVAFIVSVPLRDALYALIIHLNAHIKRIATEIDEKFFAHEKRIKQYNKRMKQTTVEAAEERQPRTLGRPRREDNPERFNVTLPGSLGEWGKKQPGGLSGLLTRLLANEKERQDKLIGE